MAMRLNTLATLGPLALATFGCAGASLSDEVGASKSPLHSVAGPGDPAACSLDDPEVVVFGDGLQVPGQAAPYAGTTDTYIDRNNPAINYGGSQDLIAKKDKSILLRFDLSTIPAGSHIACAALEWVVQDPSVRTFKAYEAQKSWVESSATWSSYGPKLTWEALGAAGTSDSGRVVVARLLGTTQATFVSPLRVATVQRWVDDPASNNGLIIRSSVANDGINVASSDSATAASRPKLYVSYPH